MGRKARRTISAALLAGVSIVLILIFRPFEGGPRYRGLSVGHWKKAIIDWRRSGRASDRGPASSADVVSRLEKLVGFRDASYKPAVLSGDAAAMPVLLQLLNDNDALLTNEVSLALLASDPDEEECIALAALLRSEKWRIRKLSRLLLVQAGRVATPGTRTPSYTGPARPGEKLPAFAANLGGGSSFTEKDLEGGSRTALIFFRGRW
ncbi:MAG TPA: hypothetical protein VGY58_07945 [Gemmataceae bacterium]|jgi:hypothetical protein|nr:hypothetical protein [Gemmataceae bacterium]